jgi:protein TonB
VSRSLILAFMMALVAHVLLAGVELDMFKGPLQVRNVPISLTVDLIHPAEEKKPEKKGIKQSITRKAKPKPKPTPTKETVSTEIPEKRLLSEKQPPQKSKVPVYLPSPGIVGEKEEQSNPEKEYAFIPDRVDIPTALPKKEDVRHTQEEDRLAPTSLDEPTTFATPDYKNNDAPTYPLLARRRNYEGTVVLDVLVRRDGTVESIRLARSSGHQSLDRSARKAVREWTFHPGKRGDEAVEMWVTIPIRFQLR